MKQIYLTFILLGFGLQLSAQKDSTRYTVISLKQAVAEHKVKTFITGSENGRRFYRVSDGDGLHYGKCMDVVLESQLDTFVILKLDAGYSLIPEDSSFSNNVYHEDN